MPSDYSIVRYKFYSSTYIRPFFAPRKCVRSSSASTDGLAPRLDHYHLSHSAGSASEGIRQSPRGERLTVPTLGPSGTHDRLYCWRKNRL